MSAHEELRYIVERTPILGIEYQVWLLEHLDEFNDELAAALKQGLQKAEVEAVRAIDTFLKQLPHTQAAPIQT